MEHFGFTKLVVADLERTGAFYRAVFGVEELARVSSDIGGRRIDEVMYKETAPGGATFVLLRFDDLASPATDGVIPGFITTDIEALVERAVAAGGAVVRAPREEPGHRVIVAFVTDVDGRLVEVVQRAG